MNKRALGSYIESQIFRMAVYIAKERRDTEPPAKDRVFSAAQRVNIDTIRILPVPTNFGKYIIIHL